MPEVKNGWTEMVYKWLTEKGEDLSDTVGDSVEKALSTLEELQETGMPTGAPEYTPKRMEEAFAGSGMDKATGISAAPSKERRALEVARRSFSPESVDPTGVGSAGAKAVFKVQARGKLSQPAYLGRQRIQKALDKVAPKLNPDTPGGDSAIKAIKKQLEHPKTTIIEDSQLKHLGEWRRPINPKTERPLGKPGHGKMSLNPKSDIATDFHEISHVVWDDIGDAQQTSFIAATESGHVPLHQRMVQKGKPYLKNTTWNQLMGENYAHWKSDWLNNTLSPAAKVDRNVIGWFEEMMGQPGLKPNWLADHQKALSVKDVEKAFFTK